MNNKKNERIIKRREFILKFLYYFSFFSVLLAFIIGAYLEKKVKDQILIFLCLQLLFILF